MKPPTSPCVGCGTILRNKPRGRPRSRCADCRYALQLRNSKVWAAKNPRYHRDYKRRAKAKARAASARQGES